MTEARPSHPVAGDRPPAIVPRDLALVLLAAALVRIAGLAGPGHGGDIQAFMDWAEGAAKFGLGGYYANGGSSNYPPMLYLLWPLGVALDGPALQFAIRTLSIPFDLGLGALLFQVARSITGRDGDGLLGAGFYLFNPAVVLVGPMWGQVDGMGALPMVGSIVAVAHRRLALAGVLAVLAGLVKPQFGIAAIVLLGLGLAWLPSRAGLRDVAVLGLASLLAWVAVLVPLGLGPLSYLDLMGDTFGQYPYISQFGFNPWGMIFGFTDDDAAWFRVGTALAIGGIAGSLWLLRHRRDLVGLLGISVLIGLAIYFLPTRVHERYLYGAIAFLAPLAAVDRRLRAPFFTLSLVFFATLAYVVANSPYRILPGDRLETFPDWAISLLSLAMTVAGAWVAVRVVGLFRIPAPDPSSAQVAGSG
jgi:dolichyl-phosphate-mannose-protein mannosyltransferase